ncbi:MAG: hypothetical protein HGA96_17595 [Desulfobulbaceae bacterium]|nr:hypothetical protein [Desulfobulbaceae bacterium]
MMGGQIVYLEFLVALCMGLAAFCLFIWSVLSGGLDEESEDVKYRVLERERDDG